METTALGKKPLFSLCRFRILYFFPDCSGTNREGPGWLAAISTLRPGPGVQLPQSSAPSVPPVTGLNDGWMIDG